VIRRIAVTLLLLASTGCTGSLLESHAEPAKVYRLGAVSVAGSGGERLDVALSVARPRAAASLDTDRVAVAQAGNAFDYFAGVRWADPAPRMLQQILVAAFTTEDSFASAVAAPSRVPTEYQLDIELRQFTAVYAAAGTAPEVRVQWQATLVDTRHGTRVASFVVESASTAAANRRDAVVAAFQQATAAVVTDTVARVHAAAAADAR